jgi:hypothetical protein
MVDEMTIEKIIHVIVMFILDVLHSCSSCHHLLQCVLLGDEVNRRPAPSPHIKFYLLPHTELLLHIVFSMIMLLQC